MLFRPFLFLCLLIGSSFFVAPAICFAQGTEIGPSGLKLPRFVSLKSDEVNVRGGPSTDHKVKWVFRRAGLPVEIFQEYDNWRRIRDSEGEEGWVFHSLLSGRRTALISPWEKSQDTSGEDNEKLINIYNSPEENAELAAQAQAGVQADIEKCHDGWCKISVRSYGGWIKANLLWGVYPDEEID